jgi:hypothetical protein
MGVYQGYKDGTAETGILQSKKPPFPTHFDTGIITLPPNSSLHHNLNNCLYRIFCFSRTSRTRRTTNATQGCRLCRSLTTGIRNGNRCAIHCLHKIHGVLVEHFSQIVGFCMDFVEFLVALSRRAGLLPLAGPNSGVEFYTPPSLERPLAWSGC